MTHFLRQTQFIDCICRPQNVCLCSFRHSLCFKNLQHFCTSCCHPVFGKWKNQLVSILPWGIKPPVQNVYFNFVICGVAPLCFLPLSPQFWPRLWELPVATHNTGPWAGPSCYSSQTFVSARSDTHSTIPLTQRLVATELDERVFVKKIVNFRLTKFVNHGNPSVNQWEYWKNERSWLCNLFGTSLLTLAALCSHNPISRESEFQIYDPINALNGLHSACSFTWLHRSLEFEEFYLRSG